MNTQTDLKRVAKLIAQNWQTIAEQKNIPIKTLIEGIMKHIDIEQEVLTKIPNLDKDILNKIWKDAQKELLKESDQELAQLN